MPVARETPEVARANPAGIRPSRWRSLGWTARAIQVRLRFFAALIVAFLVVGRWDVIRTYWDRWTAPGARDAAMGAVSADTEYFCPMDPGVLSDWPSKCPICHMALVRRKKGDMGPMPSGVVARVQLSPERIQLAGIRSAAVRYEPLAKEIRLLGAVEAEAGRTTIVAEIGREEAAWLRPGLGAEVSSDPPDGASPARGRVLAVERSAEGRDRAVIEAAPALRSGRFASATVRVPMADLEPFRSMPRGAPPIRPGESRSVFACPDHPDEPKLRPGPCPKDNIPLERAPLAPNQRLSWWCPMHPDVVADLPDRKCDECGGMTLVPRVVTYAPEGEVLAVPEGAVIDTGSRTVVYVERMPGMFDGVEVRLGPRCGALYPVVTGLESGQRVAAAGAFLVDAETRLNPSLAAGYFGAKRAAEPISTPPRAKAETLDLAALSADDRALAVTQGTCPVTGKKLGSMGTPIRLVVKGRAVFLCCEGCEGAVKAKPDQYLAKMRTVPTPPPAHHP